MSSQVAEMKEHLKERGAVEDHHTDRAITQAVSCDLTNLTCHYLGLIAFFKRYLIDESRSVLELLLAFDVELVGSTCPTPDAIQ